MNGLGVDCPRAGDIESQTSRNIQNQKRDQLTNASAITHKIPCRFGDPRPLGIFSFSLTTTIISLVNVQARGVTIPNIIIGLGLAYGGLAQFVAGMWAFAVGDTFTALVFASYGAFWTSYSLIFIPWFNIASAYGDNVQEFHSAVGHFFIGWFVLTTLITITTVRSTLAFFGVFFHLALTFLLLAVACYDNQNVHFIKAAGYVGLITGVFGWYSGASLIWNKDNSWITLPEGRFPWAKDGHYHERYGENGPDLEVR